MDSSTGRKPWFHRQRFFIQALLLFAIILVVTTGADLLSDGAGIFSESGKRIAGFLGKKAATAAIWSTFMTFMLRNQQKDRP